MPYCVRWVQSCTVIALLALRHSVIGGLCSVIRARDYVLSLGHGTMFCHYSTGLCSVIMTRDYVLSLWHFLGIFNILPDFNFRNKSKAVKFIVLFTLNEQYDCYYNRNIWPMSIYI